MSLNLHVFPLFLNGVLTSWQNCEVNSLYAVLSLSLNASVYGMLLITTLMSAVATLGLGSKKPNTEKTFTAEKSSYFMSK